MANWNNNFEATLFNTADRLRKNIDAAEYKNVVLGVRKKIKCTSSGQFG
jgi:type I restriction enzyme M protein